MHLNQAGLHILSDEYPRHTVTYAAHVAVQVEREFLLARNLGVVCGRQNRLEIQLIRRFPGSGGERSEMGVSHRLDVERELCLSRWARAPERVAVAFRSGGHGALLGSGGMLTSEPAPCTS